MCKQNSKVNTTCVRKATKKHFQKESKSCDKTLCNNGITNGDPNLNDKKNEDNIGAKQRLIAAMPKI